MHTISGIIICYNEEKNIERCIRSLQGVCDEIIVLDSYSTDQTKVLAEAMNAKVNQKEFENYGSQKIASTELSNMEYILSLDADEELSEALILEIKKMRNGEMNVAYLIPRLTNYCGHWVKYCGWYPDSKIRLWKKNEAQWTNEPVHEKVLLKNKSSIVKTLLNPILHYSISSKEEHLKKIIQYANIQAHSLFQRGKSYLSYYKYLSSIFKFIEIYFFKLGLLDGQAGLMISLRSAQGSYWKYKKLESLHQNHKTN